MSNTRKEPIRHNYFYKNTFKKKYFYKNTFKKNLKDFLLAEGPVAIGHYLNEILYTNRDT